MKILFNNEPFESPHFCGVNKHWGIVFNNLYPLHTLLEPVYIRNPFIDQNIFPRSIFYRNGLFYRNQKPLKVLNFLAKIGLHKKIRDNLIHQNKKLFLHRIKKNNFDILHIDFCESPSLKLVDRIVRHVTMPILVLVHDVIINHKIPSDNDDYKNERLSLKRQKLLTVATKILTISNQSKKDLVNFFKIAEEKIAVVYNCYEKTSSKPCPEALPAQYILYIGKRHDHKNFLFFLTSIRDILLTQKIKLVFTLSNFNDYERSYISALGLLDCCVLINSQNEETLAHLYENALCCAVPSLYEGFGMITVEAMNYGCPVAISDIAIMREIGGDAALYFNPLEQKSIYETIKKLVDDEALRHKMKGLGLERSKDFNKEKMITHLQDLYSNIVRQN